MNRTQKFHKFIKSFRPLYEQTVDEQYDKIVVPFQQQHRDLFDKSSLEEIYTLDWERFHSYMLAYIWRNRQSALSSLLGLVKGVGKEFIAKVEASDKIISRTEFPISTKGPQKRIDIVISDNKSWAVIVENKVNARVSLYKDGKSQINHYREGAQKMFPGYDLCFILLSLRENTSYLENESEWKYCSYSTLLKSLLTIDDPDGMTRDHQSAILSLLCNQSLNPDEAKKSLDSINQFRFLEDE